MSTPDLSHLPLLIRIAVQLGLLRPVPVRKESPAAQRKSRKER